MQTMKTGIERIFLLALALVLLGGTAGVRPAAAEDRMYFAGMVESNLDTLANQVLLFWGPLERSIPADIDAFRLYRRPVPGAFALIGEIPRVLADVPTIESLFMEPGEGVRLADLEDWAFVDSDGAAVGPAAFAYLHEILSQTPESPGYSPIRNLLLTRMNLGVARAVGQAYIDRTATPAGNFEYMLTGLVDGVETLPLGKTAVDTSTEDVLPAPLNFEQVFIGGCSVISRGIDDRRVHFRWDIPTEPENLNLRILTYGFDLYRSDTDLGLGANDLRAMQLAGVFNPALTKINDLPIIASGPAAEEGRDSFLAIDEGDIDNFQFLERGKTYFYYLVARDLTGKYSVNSPVIQAMVPDSFPPPAPWNFRSEEIKDPVMTEVPRIQLVWDEISPANYIRYYGAKRSFVSPPPFASPSELYFVPDGIPPTPRNLRDIDLDTERYLLFRFDTQEKAQSWGVDSDLDFWPDEIEDASGTDKCDDASHPPGDPEALIANIPVSDDSSLRMLGNGQKQRFFIDSDSMPDNHVYWYRMIAVDQFGNQSPLSPPVRGVLWDRSQPTPEASICREKCQHNILIGECPTEPGVRFKFRDPSRERQAAKACLFEVCQIRENNTVRDRPILILEALFRDGMATMSVSDLAQLGCESRCTGPNQISLGYMVRFYDERGNIIATLGPQSIPGGLCATQGTLCFDLDGKCECRPVNPGETLDPDETAEICVKLGPGERARIFHELNGKMTPFKTILAPTDSLGIMDYCEDIDLTAIVPTGACLGVRVFSKNNVGSHIQYLNCLTVPSGDPDAPLMNSVETAGTDVAPEFFVRWAAQSAGISAFVLAMQCGTNLRYETFWIDSPDIAYSNGVYTVKVDLDPDTELNKEWCFRVRAIDKALRTSDWSQQLCDTWEPEPGDHLTWPPVPETPKGEGIITYFLDSLFLPQPVLVLSGNLDEMILRETERCKIEVPDCRETQLASCLESTTINCTGICDELKAANRYGKFIVYRQEENRDFIQVSPLIDTFWCYPELTQVAAGFVTNEVLDDPFIFLVRPEQAFIQPPAIRPEVEGARLIFADSYPCRTGSRIRYQVMVIDPVTGEASETHYSNWLDVPN